MQDPLCIFEGNLEVVDKLTKIKIESRSTLYGPRLDKTCLWGFPKKRDSNQSPQLQRLARKLTFQKAYNKGADQTAQMRRLVCAFVVPKSPKTGFLVSRPISCQLTGMKYMPILFTLKLTFVQSNNVRYTSQ